MSRIRTAAVASAILVPVIAGGFIAQERSTTEGAKLFSQVLSLVSDRYVDTVDAAGLYEKAARGLVQQMQDPYTELMSPKQRADFNRGTAGKYGGLGMQIEEQPGKGITVARVFPHTPAEAAGIREGDLIIFVDTISTRGWNTRKVSDYLTGTPGTKVSATFGRPGVSEPIKATFTRAVIHVPAVPYAIMFDGKIGYLPLNQFTEASTKEVSESVRNLQSQGAHGIVLDLRGNPGGFLDQALAISNLFLKEGQEIASVRGRGTEPQQYVARERPLAADVPIVVLVDQYSASASEIVAGSLQDHDRALIVGMTSFGKGLVQTLFDLDGGWALKMTTAKWYTPAGRSIQKERKLTADGQFLEVHPDSLETDSARKARPQFKSDAGRVVYGGGGIAPDLMVKPDTFSAAEQEFRKAIAPKSQEFYVTLYDYGYELKSKVQPDFKVQPEWRAELLSRLQKAGVKVDQAQYNAAGHYVDYLIEQRVSRLAFGDSTAKRRELPEDVQLRTALDILRKTQNQKDIFVVARQTASAARQDQK
jgi:carboxyl-terminal processing protease